MQDIAVSCDHPTIPPPAKDKPHLPPSTVWLKRNRLRHRRHGSHSQQGAKGVQVRLTRHPLRERHYLRLQPSETPTSPRHSGGTQPTRHQTVLQPFPAPSHHPDPLQLRGQRPGHHERGDPTGEPPLTCSLGDLHRQRPEGVGPLDIPNTATSPKVLPQDTKTQSPPSLQVDLFSYCTDINPLVVSAESQTKNTINSATPWTKYSNPWPGNTSYDGTNRQTPPSP